MSMIWQKLIAPTAALGGYSCNVTVGDSGGGGYGYDTGLLAGVIGSIDGQPIPGETLLAVVWATGGSAFYVFFDGDITGLVGSLDAYVDGVNYGGSGSWDFADGYTNYVAGSGPSFTSGTYLFEIK